MTTHRIFVEKRPEFRVEADSLRNELNTTLGLNIKDLRVVCVYDLFGFSDSLLEKTRYGVFGEAATDTVTETPDYTDKPYLAIEALPGQFDQRASAARECVRLADPNADVEVLSARLYIFDDSVTPEQMEKISRYLVNSVESRIKNMNILAMPERAHANPVEVLDGFRNITPEEAKAYVKEKGLAMNGDDLMEVVAYFTAEGRDPNETELRILDTYWSDHCRHTTFTSQLTDIEIEDSFVAPEIRESLELWHKMRSDLGRKEKPLCLMDLATIGARWLRTNGKLDDLEQSEENNACSIYVDVDVDGETERWLLQFKNETHNHPTEIEPFGGASTCLGGAIRDPLSGRSYVYQAMRVTGAGDIWQNVEDTIPGKLPQRLISRGAAAGYSSYGNQIGLATTHVREIYHPGYVAKRLEVGAVAGAVRAADVRRERPAPGDVVLMFGGRTGRDGIGGATGSSKEHTESSLEMCGSEVQKGNAPEERKLSRLFRRPEVTKLVKKSNDFGAGGVSVAIGELTDGLDIYLDRVTTKYDGLNATELAISESQERMSVVVEAKDMQEFMDYCHEENIEVRHVADVTDTGRMRLWRNGEAVADLKREFIDSAGAPHFAKAKVQAVENKDPFARELEGKDFQEKFISNLLDPNVTSQRGLIEMFDSTIGASTVLMPFGGKTGGTETQVSVQKFPVGSHHTNTASLMSWGFDPYITEWSPYHGAAYSVISAVAKAVAAGADYRKMRFSYQEYFERMSSEKAWGKPLAALLGALRMQQELELPSIGGKDSMSGTFGELNVPPTLIAFGATALDSRDVISPEFKAAGHGLYLIEHKPLASLMPNTSALAASYPALNREIKSGNVVSAFAIGRGGLAEALVKMSLGNRIGADVSYDEVKIFDAMYGSILIEAREAVDIPGAHFIGSTTEEPTISVDHHKFDIDTLDAKVRERFNSVYPDSAATSGETPDAECDRLPEPYAGEAVERPMVYLPVFPGTNCDYDMKAAFEAEGAETSIGVFRNLTAEDIAGSCTEMAASIDACHILAISGGFSAADEPDGSGKFIATVLLNTEVRAAIERLQARGGLILGICNGFQALVKSGLLPFGKIGELTPDSPTLFRNDINRHISQIAVTRVGTVTSPWLYSFTPGQLHAVAMSHGEGKFTADEKMRKILLDNGQIAFQYADPTTGHATMQSPENPNGSTWAIEGIISPDGHILGKMGHSERYREGLMKNVTGDKKQNIFRNAVRWLQKKN
ncbi:MAG: phosphoribosylformylglycinamidine synthase [Muribaculaceae bacterium]|nr:phosphoribosylformylglycinamidine synthase [Muribaculaceae bacterium]